MAQIEGIRIRNFRSLRDVTMGKLWNLQKAEPIGPMTAVIGKNGVGKSTLFDAFGFLADCVKYGVEEACDQRGRGGFERIRSQGQDGAIEFEVYYKETKRARPITYEIAIALDANGRPFVQRESLRQCGLDIKTGRVKVFLRLENGKGAIYKEPEDDVFEMYKVRTRMVDVELENSRKLGIATLGSLKQHPRISTFLRFIEGWYLSYFTPDAARNLPLAGSQKHLSIHGDNLANVVQFMERQEPKRFKEILERIARRIPGITTIDTEKTPDGRLLLRFNDGSFKDPFYAQQMSDGALKVFAYLLLLEDPEPPPFLCIEEPENGLYHKLLETLVREFREYATRPKSRSQVFLTTHQPYLVDALTPEEVWVLEKGGDGFSTLRRASDDPLVRNLHAEGLPLGGLWYSDYLDARTR